MQLYVLISSRPSQFLILGLASCHWSLALFTSWPVAWNSDHEVLECYQWLVSVAWLWYKCVVYYSGFILKSQLQWCMCEFQKVLNISNTVDEFQKFDDT